MFSAFTKLGGGPIIIRSQDIRRLETTASGTLLVFDECGGAQELLIEGSPAENLERIAKEELDAVLRAQEMQQRTQQGFPPIPIQRGRMR